jgi:hypothetical protein
LPAHYGLISSTIELPTWWPASAISSRLVT